MDADSSSSGVQRVITKRHLMHAYNYTTDVQVAEVFGITKQAVGKWRMDKPIPYKWQALIMRAMMSKWEDMMEAAQ